MIAAEYDFAYLQYLKRQFSRLGSRIKSGDEGELLVWIISGELAGSHRPLRYHSLYGGSARFLDVGATPFLEAWVDQVKAEGIRSIICLMSSEEVGFYAQLEFGAANLLEYYRQQGFTVVSLPWKDPKHARTDPVAQQKKTAAISKTALEHFDKLPKPVPMHCSAGIDRSSPVLTFIRAQRLGRMA